ncbi:MAG: bifunctional diaminohydroxyphosphoribosylaminopyrimidine deaminase/5-amino-6-(5-phosphoribosylamino)uracil reductase RibD [Actinomycetota bacterium]|nr:bifunctional diaminohydroxyphosphoribosylaminopyrimidine deaminase/5-amino-6-(5-phosphoribosylamino)uracil reductase RibD [Actinomycetota bacterium]
MDRTDTSFMRRALRLAERGKGRTSPNPPVGAVVVASGRVVGEGWHRGAGRQHAEIEALQQAGDAAAGATLYLTLEPCIHAGRTPPCAPAVIASGVARAVIATRDPNPRIDGAGIRALEEAGIAVQTGVLENDAKHLIQAFAKHVRTGRPYLTVKSAISLDGRVAAADGSSRWVTGPTARRDAHRLRSQCDAVMVGVGTVVADNPRLTVRLRGYTGRQPTRVVLDPVARTPLDSAILQPDAPTLVAVTEKATPEAVTALRGTGAEVIELPSTEGRVSLEAVLEELGRRDMTEVLLEGGPTLLGDAVERGLVDRFIVYAAPKLLGETGPGMLAGVVVSNIDAARELQYVSVRHVGADLRIEAYPRR